MLVIGWVEVCALGGCWLLLLWLQRWERVKGRKCRRCAVCTGVWTCRRGSADGTEVAVLGTP